MRISMFALFDTKIGAFGQPFFFNHIGMARRALVDLLADPATTVSRYPEDFQFHELGIFDLNTGEYFATPVNHGSMVQFRTQAVHPDAPRALVPATQSED